MPSLIDLPTSSCFASVQLSLRRIVPRTISPFTLDEQSFLWPGEQWSVDFALPPVLSRDIAADWQAFGVSMKGSYNYFLLGDPTATVPRGVATGTPVVSSGGQTGNLLATSGWTPSTAGIILRGTYIQLGTGVNARLHMVIEDVNSNGSGNANLPIEPALRASPGLNDPVILNNPRGVFRLEDNTFGWSVLPGPRYAFSFSAIEVINA